MRRHLRRAWFLLPLAAALVYAAAHALLARRPSVADVVPREALLTARFRGVEMLDRLWFLGRPSEGRVSESIGRQRNVPGWDGVNRAGPLHLVLVPQALRPDNTLFVFPLQDADAFRAAFDGLLDDAGRTRRLERQAQHLEVHGDFAGVAWDRGLVRHLGEGGLTCAERGEDLALAVDVPAFATLAVGSARNQPFRGLLEALGAEPHKAVLQVDAATGQRRADVPVGRLPRVAAAYRTARLWVWSDARRLEAQLEPVPEGVLARRLAAAAARPAPVFQGAPAEALAWFEVPDRAALAALAEGLADAGVRLPDLPDLARLPAGAGLRGWMLENAGEGNAWTLAVEAEPEVLAALAPLADGLPAPGTPRRVPAERAPLTRSNLRGDLRPPEADLLLVPAPAADRQVLLLGADALRHAARLALSGPPVAPSPWPEPEDGGEPLRVLARFGVSAARAPDLLAEALTAGGLLHALAGGALEGEVATDGRVLRIRVRVAGR